MIPTIVHRYEIPIREAATRLVGDAAGACEGYAIKIEGEQVVVDIIPPFLGEARATLPETPPDPPKGGPLAKRAAMCCGERGFQTFLGVADADQAKATICMRCGVASRAELDHNEGAAGIWASIEGKYRLWLDGYDVEL